MILKRIATIGLSLLLVFGVAVFCTNNDKTEMVNSSVIQKPQIILDAGHGGFDGGAVANDGTTEKNINLNICLMLKEMLTQNGYDVILTRSDDASTETITDGSIAQKKKSDLNARLKLMKKYPDSIFVSIHLNKFTTSAASGAQVFYSGNYDTSLKLANCLQNSVVSLLQPENKRVCKKATSSTYLLHNATVPAVLVECGFLSNTQELKLLKEEEYQNKIAFCIFCGITEFFQNKKEI